MDQCPACAEWFHQQNRLEDLIEEKLRHGPSPGPTPALWTTVLTQSGIKQKPTSVRHWMFWGGLLALSASLFVAVCLGVAHYASKWEQPLNLAEITARYHAGFSEGRQFVEFQSRSDLEVEDYLHRRVSFPVRCPPRQDTGFKVQGAGTCRLNSSEAAYLVGQLEGKPVSIFIFPRESLSHFPHQEQALQREGTHGCREGIYEMMMTEIDGSVVLVIGQTQPGSKWPTPIWNTRKPCWNMPRFARRSTAIL